MPTVEQARNQAVGQAQDKIRLKVAEQLKVNWGGIQLAASQVGKSLQGVPTDEDFWNMSGTLINDRELTFNNTEISLQELDTLPQETKDKVLAPLGVNSFKKLIPTRQEANAIAGAIGDGVGENVSDDTPGFMQGATWANVIQGFFRWLIGLFTGESSFSFDSIKGAIASVTADKMGESVGSNLEHLRHNADGTPSDLSRFISSDMVAESSKSVRDSVMSQAAAPAGGDSGTPGAPAAPWAGLASTSVGDTSKLRESARTMLKDSLHEQVLAGFMKKEQFAGAFPELKGKSDEGILDIAGNYAKNGVVMVSNWFGVKSEDQQKRDAVVSVSSAVSERLSRVVTDPNYRYDGKSLGEMSSGDRAKVMGEEARLAVEELANKAPKEQKMIYLAIQAELPAEITANVLKSEQPGERHIPWVIAGNPVQNNARDSIRIRDHKEQDIAKLNAAVADNISAKLDTMLKEHPADAQRMAQMLGGPITQAHRDAVAQSVAPVMVEMGRDATKVPKTATGEVDLEAISTRMRDALIANKAKINVGGINASDGALAALADQMTVQFAKEQLEVPVPDTFAKAVSQRQVAAAIDTSFHSKETAPMLGQLAGLPEGQRLDDGTTQRMANATAGVLNKYVDDPSKLAAMNFKEKGYNALAQEIYIAMARDKRDHGGYSLSNEALRVVADYTAVNFIASQAPDQAPAMLPQGMTSKIRADLTEAIAPQVRAKIDAEMGYWSGVGMQFAHGNTFSSIDVDGIKHDTARTIADAVSDPNFNRMDAAGKKENLMIRLAGRLSEHKGVLNLGDDAQAAGIAQRMIKDMDINKLPAVKLPNPVTVADGTTVAPLPTTVVASTELKR